MATGQTAARKLELVGDAPDKTPNATTKTRARAVTSAALRSEIDRLIAAAKEGQLDARADTTALTGPDCALAQGINEMLDAFTGPVRVTADCVARISRGDIPEPITEEYGGDFAALRDNLNGCIEAINTVLDETGTLAMAVSAGKLDTTADASRLPGDFGKIIGNANALIAAILPPLQETVDVVTRLGLNDTTVEVTGDYQGMWAEVKTGVNNACTRVGNVVRIITNVSNGDLSDIDGLRALGRRSQNDELVPSLIRLIDAIEAVANDTNTLSQAAVAGQLATRADASKHGGDFARLVQGFNDTLDAVIGPLHVAADYVEQIGRGVIPERITDEYRGDFNTIKSDLNQCIDGLGGLVEADAVLQRMAVNDYTRRIEGQYQGVFADVAKAVTDVQDRITHITGTIKHIASGDLHELEAYKQLGDGTGRRCPQDELAPSMIVLMESLTELVTDAEMLAQAAVDGLLETRADISKHSGSFAEVMQGINNTLDAIVRPVNEEAGVLGDVSANDLTARMKGDYRGDFAKIKESLNKALDTLDSGLGQVAVGAEQVASASGQISNGSQSLAKGAGEQASALEEVSSSLQEMSSMTLQNASNAKEARGLSDAARGGVLKGVDSMNRLSEAIDRIKKSSDETAKIVKTIDEIAFQTNLLALNAAVEAARAGDAGKGFAVVAEEVRNLAMRSAEAAKNTASMIDESVRNAGDGVSINQEVLKNLDEITEQINKVNEVMGEIAAASEQQSQGIGQVNKAVDQLNQITQQTAANSEESASAAEELSGQAEEMRSLVAAFKLSDMVDSHGRGAAHVDARRPSAPPARAATGAAPARGAVRPNPRQVIPLDDDDRGTLGEF